MYFENYDLNNIVTPVKVDVLVSKLRSAGYNEHKIQFLEKGFMSGFDVGYEGPQVRQSESENIPLRVGSKMQLWNKLMKEVELKRVAGPYSKEQIPFGNFIQSPIGLVPKAGNSGKTRLIFHLSYDFTRNKPEKSLNFHTPKKNAQLSTEIWTMWLEHT